MNNLETIDTNELDKSIDTIAILQKEFPIDKELKEVQYNQMLSGEDSAIERLKEKGVINNTGTGFIFGNEEIDFADWIMENCELSLSKSTWWHREKGEYLNTIQLYHEYRQSKTFKT
ncbi:MAG: hypothetical protein JWO92_1126 [Chitinophagaceae bacterium]|nr:hypothetical protein [Chitinophagaceae bacterium]